MRNARTYLLLIFSVLSFLLVAEHEDVFLLLGYGVGYCFVLSIVLVDLVGIFWRNPNKQPNFGTLHLAGSIALISAFFACSLYATDIRKDFFLTCRSVMGQSERDTRAGMARGNTTVYEKHYPESLTFFFNSGPGTTDCCIVRFREGRVVEAEYSPD